MWRGDGAFRRLGHVRHASVVGRFTSRFLSSGRLCVENGYRYEWKPGESSFFPESKMRKRMKCQVEKHGPLVVPGVLSTKSGPEQTALGNSSLELPEWLEPFTEGMSEGASSSSTDPVPTEPLPAIPPPNRLEKPSSNKPASQGSSGSGVTSALKEACDQSMYCSHV